MSYYISPRFLDKLAVHITKNFLDLPGVRVPLILGIHGRKGEGKSFQCELVFERMKIEVIHISGGELESPDAGDPARLIRLRYREAAELIKVRGKMVALMINDLDAGAGRFDEGTQYTVNTQLVNATLMNIADNPTDVQLPGSYDSTPLHRVPILVTGNDFSTLYAPLIREGRMEKFYWEPDRDDKIGIVGGIFSADNLPPQAIAQLVDTFPNQAIDFFSALRSRVYDEQIRRFIHNIGVENVSLRVVNSNEGPPTFKKPEFGLSHLIEHGNFMVQEQQRVDNSRLVHEYNQALYYANRNPISANRGQATPSQSNPAPVTPQNNSANPGQQPISEYNSSHHAPEKPREPASFKPTQYKLSSLTPPHYNGSNTSTNRHNEVLTRRVGLQTLEQVKNLIAQGYHIGIEYVDKRRFRTGSWQSCSPAIFGESEAVIALETCLDEHTGDYVRIFGVDPKNKRRIMETVVQRPDDN
ncbi:ribulose bisphosphate carboxylase small subunit [Gloeocapsopsis dulcis]|uniref:Ribulose 1,5-bisphosphate carboxylase small subunit n=1 Tax=Gloeocapsopsis dulcis AAB1 = 1H9 TaxID=1433147 RepID=A0A6N8G036_9CHRO|nr:ribulose bisphosphate carboxylase small subunit [Gloeocapsopsis dulcis]MUL37935.1 ribulose 1,5-bisphosphate carboxylase small subunit [Gloeocapsopsis dulcis AAB1 = 1H9]WNN87331.1 ribulose bisphosphate carboxylase small subunit [Gloeocapsopsis dulcis]